MSRRLPALIVLLCLAAPAMDPIPDRGSNGKDYMTQEGVAELHTGGFEIGTPASRC